METRQVRNVKRIGTWLSLGLIGLSVGLMLLGWTLPRNAAFEAGVFGFQLFPLAVLAVLVRITLPHFAATSFGNRLIELIASAILIITAILCWIRNRITRLASSTNTGNEYPKHNQRCSDDVAFIDASSPVEDAFHDPLRYGPLNTSPLHEDPISNPDGYIPDYEAIFDNEASGSEYS